MNLFVTGTDTDCGKTYISAAIIRLLAQNGFSVTGMKPIASGAGSAADPLSNDDVAALVAAANTDLALSDINQYLFQPPVSPHIAAARAKERVRPKPVLEAYERCARASDFVLVEGAGGWRVPLGDSFDISDLAVALNLPVLLVVGVQLGCINHARLSAEAIKNDGLNLVGWVANCHQPDVLEAGMVIETMRRHINAPCWGVVPRGGGGELLDAAVAHARLEQAG